MSENCLLCSDRAVFSLKRVHDGGGRQFACANHVAAVTVEVASSLPDWASARNHDVVVRVMGVES